MQGSEHLAAFIDQAEQKRVATASQSPVVNNKGSDNERHILAARVARLSRAAGSPINAYHARADVDEWLDMRGMYLRDLPAMYERFYGMSFDQAIPPIRTTA